MPKTVLPTALRDGVRSRANKRCEYCQSQDRYSPNLFTVDHSLPPDLGGTDDMDNLAYACFLCNRLKSNKTTVFDPLSQTQALVFNPRTQVWQEHFTWNEEFTHIIGLSPTGRGTIVLLQLNREKLLEYRKALLQCGAHP